MYLRWDGVLRRGGQSLDGAAGLTAAHGSGRRLHSSHGAGGRTHKGRLRVRRGGIGQRVGHQLHRLGDVRLQVEHLPWQTGEIQKV